MAVVSGIKVTKEGDKHVWRHGLALWEFKPWPQQRLWRNGQCMTYLANGCGLKLVEDAVRFAMGYEHGLMNGNMPKDDIILAK